MTCTRETWYDVFIYKSRMRNNTAAKIWTDDLLLGHPPTTVILTPASQQQDFQRVRARHTNMITKFISSVSTSFSPFNTRSGKTARNFLALLPPNARSTMAIDVKMLPRAQAEQPGYLGLKFSTLVFYSPPKHDGS